jgi:hypothetical protein
MSKCECSMTASSAPTCMVFLNDIYDIQVKSQT